MNEENKSKLYTDNLISVGFIGKSNLIGFNALFSKLLSKVHIQLSLFSIIPVNKVEYLNYLILNIFSRFNMISYFKKNYPFQDKITQYNNHIEFLKSLSSPKIIFFDINGFSNLIQMTEYFEVEFTV